MKYVIDVQEIIVSHTCVNHDDDDTCKLDTITISNVVTYILKSETGASLKASNFVYDGIVGGTHWTGKRNKGQAIPNEMKQRWIKEL